MNSIFRKTLIATILSTILGTVAIAADDYQGKSPCNDDMKATGKSDNQGQESQGSENRPLSDHQDNVIDGEENATDKSDNHDQESHGSENRPLSDHQDNVIEEEE
jgi:hypothetical protein